MMLAWVRPFAGWRHAPVLLAAILAICSIPVVILDVPGFDPALFTHSYDAPRMSLLDPAVLSASSGAGAFGVLIRGAG